MIPGVTYIANQRAKKAAPAVIKLESSSTLPMPMS